MLGNPHVQFGGGESEKYHSQWQLVGFLSYMTQIHEIHSIEEEVDEFCRHLQTQTRFPRATRSCQSHQSHILALKKVLNGCNFLFSTKEWSQLDRQVIGKAIKGLKGREIGRQAHDDKLIQISWTL
jgi:hypothetical protein